MDAFAATLFRATRLLPVVAGGRGRGPLYLPLVALPKSTAPRSGLALVLCFVVLLALFALAVPFLGSMNVHARSAETLKTRTLVKHDARSIANLAVVHLRRCQTIIEGNALLGLQPTVSLLDPYTQQPIPLNTPDTDGELEIGAGYYLSELLTWQTQQGTRRRGSATPAINVRDPRGRIWTVTVEDEQGKVNLDTATPWLLGNLVAPMPLRSISPSTTLTGGTLSVIAPFATADPAEIARVTDPDGGYLWIDGELVTYAKVTGSPGASPPTWTFQQVTRQVNADPAAGLYEFRTVLDHTVGTPVVPAIAYKMFHHAYDPLTLAQNGNRPAFFRDVDSVRLLADRSKFYGIPAARPFDGGGCETMHPDTFAVLKPHLTVYSSARFQNQFFNPHVLVSNLPSNPANPQQLVLDGNRGINPGTMLRLRSDTGTVGYAMAVAVAGPTVIIDRAPPGTYRANRTIVEVLDRHPININTASRRVLIAVFANLRVTTLDSVSLPEAVAVADAVIARVHDAASSMPNPQPFIDANDFETWLTAEVNAGRLNLSGPDVQAIRLNARYPFNATLLSPTAPFCYQTFDSYTLHVDATWNNDAGVPEGRFSLTQVRDIGAPGATGTFAQETLQDMLDMRGLSIGTGLRIINRGTINGQPVAQIELDINPGVAPPANPPPLYSFTDYPAADPNNSVDLGRSVALGQPLLLDSTFFGTGPTGRVDMQAGSLAFWIKPDDFGANAYTYFFDLHDPSEPPHANRFSVFYERARNAIVVRMADAGLGTAYVDLVYPLRPTAGVPQGPAGVYMLNPLGEAMRAGTWYHCNITWKGQSFTNLSGNPAPIYPRFNMLIDGIGATPINRSPSYVTHTFQAQPTSQPIEIMTTLAQDLIATPADTTDPAFYEIRLRDSSFLPAAGVVDVNGECVWYTINDTGTNTLRGTTIPASPPLVPNPIIGGFTRGARGTTASFHATGTPVTFWGYSTRMIAHAQAPFIPAVSGETTADFGTAIVTTVACEGTADIAYQNSDRWGPDAGLSETDGVILVPPGGVDDFPDQGYVLVRGAAWLMWVNDPLLLPPADVPDWIDGGGGGPVGEIIFYSGKQTGLTDPVGNPADGLTIVERDSITWSAQPGGITGPPPYHFENGSTVTLISFELTDSTGYISSPPANGTYVYCHNGTYGSGAGAGEVLRYNEINTSHGDFFVWNDSNPAGWRGRLATGAKTHTATEKVVPVFRVAGARSHQYAPSAGVTNFPQLPVVGSGDIITVIADHNSAKTNMWLDGVTPLRVAWTVGSPQQWCAFDDFTANVYSPGNGSRLLKFPSGELPISLPTQAAFGGQSGGATGYACSCIVDEVEMSGLGAGNFRTAVDIDAVVTSIPVNSVGALNPSVGVIRVDDELIAYRGFAGNTLASCTRGFLGTIPAPHSEGTLYLNMANLKVGLLSQAMGATAGAGFSLNGLQNDFDSVGYALVGTNPANMEVIGYLHQPGTPTFQVSQYAPQNRGLYRGRFGTVVQTHGIGAGAFNPVMIGMPYRYIDRFADPSMMLDVSNNPTIPGNAIFINSPEQNTVGGAFAARNAQLVDVTWTIEDSPEFGTAIVAGLAYEDYVDIQLYLKPDTVASWEDPGVQKFSFNVNSAARDYEGTLNVLRQTDQLQNVACDSFEWRVAFAFRNNAYLFDAWKWTPRFLSLTLQYRQGGRLHEFHEDIR